MKAGRSLTELATELERQVNSKRDYLADSRALKMEIVEDNTPALVIPNGITQRFGITDVAHAQVATKISIPRPYYERMRKDAPQLLAQSELYDHNDICPGRPDCGHCKNCGERFTGDHCPCEDQIPITCPNCGHERTVSRDVFEEGGGRIGVCPKCCAELVRGEKMTIFKRQYCGNCREVLADLKVVNLDMVMWVCSDCYDKRPEGWEMEPLCLCCGELRCGCSIQDNYEDRDPATGYLAIVRFCTTCRKRVD